MASRKTTFTVYTYDANGQITLVEDPKVLQRMRRLSRILWRQVAGCRSVITTYTYSRETRKRRESRGG